MRLLEVKDIIEKSNVKGYCVHFEHIEGSLLKGDFYPDVRNGEQPFFDRVEAIESGIEFAAATKGKTCNFYLIDHRSIVPVGGWHLNNR